MVRLTASHHELTYRMRACRRRWCKCCSCDQKISSHLSAVKLDPVIHQHVEARGTGQAPGVRAVESQEVDADIDLDNFPTLEETMDVGAEDMLIEMTYT